LPPIEGTNHGRVIIIGSGRLENKKTSKQLFPRRKPSKLKYLGKGRSAEGRREGRRGAVSARAVAQIELERHVVLSNGRVWNLIRDSKERIFNSQVYARMSNSREYFETIKSAAGRRDDVSVKEGREESIQ